MGITKVEIALKILMKKPMNLKRRKKTAGMISQCCSKEYFTGNIHNSNSVIVLKFVATYLNPKKTRQCCFKLIIIISSPIGKIYVLIICMETIKSHSRELITVPSGLSLYN